MKKTILLYWPTEGNVETCATLIKDKMENTEMKPITKVSLNDLKSCDQYIIGCSTVGSETWENTENKDPWQDFLKLLDEIGMTEKAVALFGLGDQIRWPKHFVDGMAIIYEQVVKKGAKVVGRWSVEGYEHDESEAQEGDLFFGLALDEDHQPELTSERVEKWVKQLEEEF